MSHDIRTPMNAIIGYANLASRHIDDTERLKKYMKNIQSCGQNLLSLLNDVLDLARIENKQGRNAVCRVGCPGRLYELCYNVPATGRK